MGRRRTLPLQWPHGRGRRRLLPDPEQLIRKSTRREIYRRIGLATDYLHSHYREQVDLRTLGRAACMSKFHFLRLFTLVHGITPHQYLLRKRAKAALRLLQATSLDVSEVAASVGFSQRHVLLRQMRRWTGLSPREIRRRCRAEGSKVCTPTAVA